MDIYLGRVSGLRVQEWHRLIAPSGAQACFACYFFFRRLGRWFGALAAAGLAAPGRRSARPTLEAKLATGRLVRLPLEGRRCMRDRLLAEAYW